MQLIGWVPLNEAGDPNRPDLGRDWRARKKPVTVYQTEVRARTYSPVKKALPVYMGEFPVVLDSLEQDADIEAETSRMATLD